MSYSLDDFSLTYQRHYDELAALTQNQIEGMMTRQDDYPTQTVTNME